MLEKVEVGTKSFEDYCFFCKDRQKAELDALKRELKGLRVCHISSTPFGGGVAEILYSYVPLLRGIGVKADWRIISAGEQFFSITKSFHNALQGAEYSPTKQELDTYIKTNAANARRFAPAYDVIIVHDPQPAAMRHFCHTNSVKWMWRCHIDTSGANPDVFRFLKPYIDEYDQAIFSLGEFVP
ncbi:MAG: glycosyl transferase family 1, partial [Chloroflexi bacterium]|nr:glycosyl transferase family 1 [Chloroflexota bacterium]